MHALARRTVRAQREVCKPHKLDGIEQDEHAERPKHGLVEGLARGDIHDLSVYMIEDAHAQSP